MKQYNSISFFNIPKTDILSEKIYKVQDYFEQIGLSRDEEKWKFLVFKFLFKFYNENAYHKHYFSNKSEMEIKEYIRNWLNSDIEFRSALIINLELKSEGTDQEGYDDIKFQSNLWNVGRSFFVFECKLMDESETKTKEYTYRSATQSKEADGGLYRFLINKYAANKEFGGMIGFVVKGKINNVIRNVKNRISELKITENSLEFGQLTEPEILNKTIAGNRETFLSEHIRWDKDTNNMISPVLIYHIFFDMANNRTFN